MAYGELTLENLMFSVEDRCGVLCDYDLIVLSSLGRPRVRGTEMTGTVTSMALELLSQRDDCSDGFLKRQ